MISLMLIKQLTTLVWSH